MTKHLLPVLFLLFIFGSLFSQIEKRTGIRIMFYNVENLFDTINDPKTNDDDFTPAGNHRWNGYRLNKKLNNIYKVIVSAGGAEPPEIVAFSEVENRKVIENLIYNTPLVKYRYAVVHEESPDGRGIDVALIYRPDKIHKLSSQYFSINQGNTRDILYFTFLSPAKDTVHLFVNHWSSRSGGQLATEKKRNAAARILRSKTDSIFRKNANAKIILTGDFNDTPADKSITGTLQVLKGMDAPVSGSLYNLSSAGTVPGTIKYKGQWDIFDQFIVSGSFLIPHGTYTRSDLFRIYAEDFLLKPDERYLGKRPFRTYYGFRYEGGYSDHLPVLLDLKW